MIEPIYVDVGRRIAMAREIGGLTQEALGRRLRPRLSRQAVSNMESGRQRIMLHILVGVAHALDVSVWRLVPKEARGEQR